MSPPGRAGRRLVARQQVGQIGDAHGRDGRYRGTPRVEREIRMVVQKRDGTSATLTPAEFEQKYGWKNEPERVRLMAE